MSVSCTEHENMSDSGSEPGGPYGNNLRLFSAIRNPSFDEVKRHQSRAGDSNPLRQAEALRSYSHVYFPYIRNILIPKNPRDISVT